MLTVALIVLWMAVCALLAGGYVAFVALKTKIDQLDLPLSSAETRPEPSVTPEENAAAIERLTVAVSEGIAGFKRHEKRVQKTVKSARRLLAENGLEHAGLEAEAAEIRERDEPGIDPFGMPPVLESVASDRPTGIPGVTHDDLAMLREQRVS